MAKARRSSTTLDLRLLEYFSAVVAHAGITRAAEALFISQPSLSQAIIKLEQNLGVQLFLRTPRSLSLTPAGEQLVAQAQEVLAGVAVAKERVSRVREVRSGRIDVGVVAGLATDPFPRVAAAFRDRYPGVVINVLNPGSPDDAVTHVQQGRAELALTYTPESVGSLEVEQIGSQRFVLVMAGSLARAMRAPLVLSELQGLPLIVESGDPVARELIAHSDGLRDSVAVECADRATTWEMVRIGVGAMVMPAQLAHSAIPEAVSMPTDPPIHRSIALLRRPGALSPAATAMRAAMSELSTRGPFWSPGNVGPI